MSDIDWIGTRKTAPRQTDGFDSFVTYSTGLEIKRKKNFVFYFLFFLREYTTEMSVFVFVTVFIGN